MRTVFIYYSRHCPRKASGEEGALLNICKNHWGRVEQKGRIRVKLATMKHILSGTSPQSKIRVYVPINIYQSERA